MLAQQTAKMRHFSGSPSAMLDVRPCMYHLGNLLANFIFHFLRQHRNDPQRRCAQYCRKNAVCSHFGDPGIQEFMHFDKCWHAACPLSRYTIGGELRIWKKRYRGSSAVVSRRHPTCFVSQAPHGLPVCNPGHEVLVAVPAGQRRDCGKVLGRSLVLLGHEGSRGFEDQPQTHPGARRLLPCVVPHPTSNGC